jgi:mono/diheme cytochrome c family protein
VVAVALAACGTAPTSTGGRADGRLLFTSSGCGGCHTLVAAGANGKSGPNFDTSEKLSRRQIIRQLNSGTGGMPSFRARLSDAQETALADFLYSATHMR